MDKKSSAGKTEQKRDAGLARMLNTPPKPHKEMKKGKAAKPEEKPAHRAILPFLRLGMGF